MMLDKQVIKQFIMDYHKEKASNVVSYDDTDIDDFFSLSDEVEPFELSENTSNQVFFNELDQLIYTVGTRREYYIFFLLCEGKSMNEIAKIFELSRERIRQLLNSLLDKLEEG